MYKGNPMEKHLALNLKEPLKVEHLDKWISIWYNTVDENFKGEIANKAKKQALLIKNLLLYKIEASNKRNSIQ